MFNTIWPSPPDEPPKPAARKAFIRSSVGLKLWLPGRVASAVRLLATVLAMPLPLTYVDDIAAL
ncbi:hypothetical protein ACQE3E_23905 (plasmid) [Methylomonas sp. MED-D]|uniref:hypothetical protein n=1 Tax=Methylomonas sp. MED-D TaxID=3418768 RepID=UPI003D0882E0